MYSCKRKYKIHLWFFIIGVFSLTGQEEDRKRLAISPFENLKIFSNIDVNLIQSEANMVIVYGENSDNIIVSIKNRELKINLIGGNILNSEKTKIELYHSNSLKKIIVLKGASLSSKYHINQESLTLEAKLNGIIDLDISAEKLRTNISLGGRVYLKGKVINHELTIYTSGVCEAERLDAKETKITSKGGAYAYVNTKSLLTANIYGGVIREFGKPKKKNIEKRFGGKIYIKK